MRCKSWPTTAALLLAALLGCSSRPVAPILSDSNVYQNAAEGFRFLVPDGWTQTANSMLPPGRLNAEVFLVRYSVSSSELGATLQVLCMDDAESIDLESYHAGPSYRVDRWEATQPGQDISINGAPDERIVYRALTDGREMTKYVTCFRHNGRVYSFIGLYASSDEMAGQQIERATDSVIWAK